MPHVYLRESASLSLSLSKECGSSCTRRYDHVWVIGCVGGGRSSLICCVGDGRGRVGETLGRKPSRFPPRTEAWPNDHVAQLYCRVQPWSAVLTRTPPNQALESPFSPAPWEAGRAPTPWSGTPFIPPVACPAGLTSRGGPRSQSRPRQRVAPRASLNALRAGRRYCGADICELLPRLSVRSAA